MKSPILTISLSVMMSVMAVTVSAQEQNKDAEHARKNLAEANKDLEQAKKDSISDFKKFKEDAKLKIKKNEKEISELKLKKADANKEIQLTYSKKVAEIEQKNNELRKKLDGCDEHEKSKWELFKKDFNEKMDDLGKSISEMTKK